jgi:hypothetical protein
MSETTKSGRPEKGEAGCGRTTNDRRLRPDGLMIAPPRKSFHLQIMIGSN